MSNASINAFLQALSTGLYGEDRKMFLKFIECYGPSTWKEVQSEVERLEGHRSNDSRFSGPASTLHKSGKLVIVSEKKNPKSGRMNSVYELAERYYAKK